MRHLKVSELLVGQGLDGRRVDGPRHVLHGERDGVLGHDRLSGRRVSRDEDRLVLLEADDGLLLERVQLERPGVNVRNNFLGDFHQLSAKKIGDFPKNLEPILRLKYLQIGTTPAPE
jgi:hypothetical protein